jgi:mercuric ion transport protein
MKIELVYDSNCPNVERARENVRLALKQTGIKAGWQEWERGDPDTPGHLLNYGSPTILVNGKDIITNMPDSHSESCRLYADINGQLQGVPPVEAIVIAITNKRAGITRSRIGGIIGALPAIGVAFLPKIACPICWPAYAALLSAVGLGFLIQGNNLLIVSMVFLGLALAVFGLRGRNRKNFMPFWLALVGVSFIIPGKFLWENMVMFYAGTVFLTVAVILDIWPLNKLASCQDCNEKNSREVI